MDVFISYEHESKQIADNICATLESRGVRCWYAPRDVYGDYATSIVEAIESCKVFILILNHSSSESPHVLNEVEMAYKRILNGEIVIIPFKVDEGMLSKAMEYYVKRLHWIDAVSAPLEKCIHQLYEQLVPILGLEKKEMLSLNHEKESNLKRKTNQYYSPEDEVEIARLQSEEELLYKYEKPYYDKLLFGRKDVNVLDFDVLTPEMSSRRFERSEIGKVAYFAYNEQMVKEGNELCEGSEHHRFFHLDITTRKIDDIIPEAMKELGIEGFDFLNLTLAIMNLEQPFKILKQLKKYMNSGAVAYVRDVDDCFVFAYPDEKNLFAEFKEFYKYDSLSGSRESGRQIFNILKKIGAKEIKLERCGINTASMDYDERRLLFESWFRFIPNDYEQMLKKNKNDEYAREVLDWIEEHFDDLEESFFDDDFLFNAGYIIYTVHF